MKIIEPKISSDLEVKNKFEPVEENFYNCIFENQQLNNININNI